MPYAFIQDVPATREIYAQIRERLGESPPPGLITHVVADHDDGLRYIDVWESEEAWTAFRDEQVEPVVAEVLASCGIPHDHSLVRFEPLQLVDVWRGVPAER